MTGVEVCGHLLSRHHGHVIGQQRVQRLGRSLDGRAAAEVRADDVPQRVYARVGAPRDSGVLCNGEERAQRLYDDTFDRAQPGLRRPAVEVRAVVLERELQPHARSLYELVG